ncbi:hypothetical protein Tco_0663973 [Tanacetum coccineum]
MYYDYTSSQNHLVEMPKNGGTMRSKEKPSVGMKRVISSVVNITPHPIPAIVRTYAVNEIDLDDDEMKTPRVDLLGILIPRSTLFAQFTQMRRNHPDEIL